MNGRHDDVPVLFDAVYPIGKALRRFGGKIGQTIHAGFVVRCRPFERDSAGIAAEAENQDTPLAGQIQNRRGFRFPAVSAGTRGFQRGLFQCVQSVVQSWIAPVEHMIVGQYATIDPGSGEAGGVGRMHPVVDAFVGPVIVAGGDRRFKVDHADIKPGAIEFGEGFAPDIGIIDGLPDGAVEPFRQFDVNLRVSDIGLVDLGIAGLRQNLVYASSGHDIAAQKELDSMGSLFHWENLFPVGRSKRFARGEQAEAGHGEA